MHTTFSILAIYRPAEINVETAKLPTLARHVMDVAIEGFRYDDYERAAFAKAEATPPAGYHVMAMMVLRKGDEANGYSATMAKVNYHAGHVGCPA